MNEEDNEEKSKQISKHRKNARRTLIIGVTVLIVAPVILTQNAFFSFFDFTQTGPIGDTIGGITSPVVNLVAAILVYLSFQQQILANEIQINSLNQDKKNERAKVDKELLLLFYNEIKESLGKLEYSSVSTIARERGRHGTAIKAIDAYTLDCHSFRDSIREKTDFHIRLLTVLSEVQEYIETCRGSDLLTLKEVKFFIKRIEIIFLYYLKLPLDGFDENESHFPEDERISFKIATIESLLEKSLLE